MSSPPLDEKHHGKEVVDSHGYLHDPHSSDEEVGMVNKASPLSRDLRSRHMQMIAMGKPSSKPYQSTFSTLGVWSSQICLADANDGFD
jgi:hypothetical protein